MDYSLFDFPLLWRKTQLGEEAQVNVMGSINEPFLATGRFEATFSAAPPRYTLTLTIDGQSWAHAQHEW